MPNKLCCDEIRKADYNEIGSEYSSLGPPFSNRGFSLYIKSSLDDPIFLSLDGVNDHLYIEAGASLQFNCGSHETGLALPIGTQLYHKRGPGGDPAGGALYLTILYVG